MGVKRIANISIHCFKSFPVRLFHSRLKEKGIEPWSFFFKDSKANTHKPVTEKEMELLRNLIKESKADVFGISIFAPYVTIAKEIIKEIRKVSTSPIIIGGVYATITPEKALEIGDYACKGEGEIVFDTVAERLIKGEDLKGIPGLWHKDENGNIVNQGMQKITADLNSMPNQAVGQPHMYFIENDRIFARDPEVLDKYVWIMASRGCMYQCSFCVNAVYIPLYKEGSKFVRQRSPENVVQEIEERVKNHVTPVEEIFFADELFGIYGKWIEEFCEQYKKRVNLPFFMELHPNLIKEDNIRMLADAGLYSLDFGIQSGSQRIRNGVMNRPGSNQGIIESSRLLKKYNVLPVYDLILDNPFDTVEDLKESVELILQLPKPYRFNVFKMQYFQNYPYTTAALEKGFITQNDLTDENIAKSTLTTWTFRPKIFSRNKKDYLQSCIYLVVRDARGGEWIAKKNLKLNNFVYGNLANIVARMAYIWWIKTPAWIHRCVNALRILLKGDFKKFIERMKIQFQRKFGKLREISDGNDHAAINRGEFLAKKRVNNLSYPVSGN